MNTRRAGINDRVNVFPLFRICLGTSGTLPSQVYRQRFPLTHFPSRGVHRARRIPAASSRRVLARETRGTPGGVPRNFGEPEAREEVSDSEGCTPSRLSERGTCAQVCACL